MSDRVPICTIPGLVDSLVDVDVMIAPATTAMIITRVFLSRTDNGVGDVVTASVRNATANGGEGIAVTLASTEDEKTATGSVTVEATEPVYLRVSAADANSQNLRGWFEVDTTSGAVSAALTTLAYVQQFLGISGDGDILNNLIARVSSEVQGWLDRAIIQATATDEKLDSIGDSKLHTRYFPIISIGSLEENGSVLVEDTGFECLGQDKLAGALVRISGDYTIGWASGRRVVKLTYDHGYATVPPAIVQAATELVAFDYLQSGASTQSRFGMGGKATDQGGTSSYTTRADLWEACKPRLSPFRRAWM